MLPISAESVLKFFSPAEALDRIGRPQVLGGMVVAVGSLVAFRWYRQRKIDRFTEVPGWPILEFEPSRGVEILQNWARKYGGEGVYEVTLMGERLIVVCGMDPLIEVFALRPLKMTRPSAYHHLGFPEIMNGVFFVEGRSWQTQRRLVAPAFNSKSIKDFIPLVCPIVEAMTRKVRDAAKAGEKVNVSRLFQLMNIDITTRVAFGVDWGAMTGNAEEVEWLHGLLEAIWQRVSAPVSYWKVPGLARLVGDCGRPCLDKMRKALTKILDRPCKEHTLLAKFVQRVDGEALSREDLIGNLIVLFVAGADTTTHTLAWAMYHLANNPGLQDELSADAHRFAPGPAIAEAAAGGVEGLVLARAVMTETLRLNGPSPLLDFENVEPFTLAGRTVPANSTILCLLRPATEQSPSARDALGSDMDIFRPSRWIGLDRKLVQCPPFNTIQFGHGARICVGMGLAHFVMTLVLSELMRAFRIEKWDGPPMPERTTFVQRPAEDICVRLVPRA